MKDLHRRPRHRNVRTVVCAASMLAAIAWAGVAGALDAETGKCSADPALNPLALIVSVRGDAGALRDRIASDSAFAARFGNPAVLPGGVVDRFATLTFGYPPLQDPVIEYARVQAQPEVARVAGNGRLCFATPPPDSIATVVEFRHPVLDQYFYSADAGEIAVLDAGLAGGWIRTGESFAAVVVPGCPFTTDTPVYRFAAAPGAATGSHFFTRDRSECFVVDVSRQWSFEGLPFWAAPLRGDGTCPLDRIPLTRLWRPFGSSTHRFTTTPSIVAEMQAQGWVAEGPAMCVAAPRR